LVRASPGNLVRAPVCEAKRQQFFDDRRKSKQGRCDQRGYHRLRSIEAKTMAQNKSIELVEKFWAEVWQRPQNPHAIDTMVAEDFVITSGGHDIVSRKAFKDWVTDFQSKVHDMDFEIIESFQNHDGSRVASRWRLTGRNNGIMGTEPNGEPIDMVGTAIWEIGEDGLLHHNWVERNAWEVHGALTPGNTKPIF
jgi:hypothetical protein